MRRLLVLVLFAVSFLAAWSAEAATEDCQEARLPSVMGKDVYIAVCPEARKSPRPSDYVGPMWLGIEGYDGQGGSTHVLHVYSDTPAAKAGILAGDTIVAAESWRGKLMTLAEARESIEIGQEFFVIISRKVSDDKYMIKRVMVEFVPMSPNWRDISPWSRTTGWFGYIPSGKPY